MQTHRPIPRLASAVRSLFADSLPRNGLYIMATTAVTSLLGFGFWIIAARILEAADVGQSAALISVMLFVAVITNLGLGQVFVSRLAARADGPEWSLTVSTGVAVTAVTSLVGGTVAALLVPVLIPALKEGLSPAAFALLPFGVAGAACSLVLDFACIAERKAKAAFIRNGIAALTRILLLGLAAVGPLDNATWLLGIWVGSFLLIDAFAFTRVIPGLGRDFRPTMSGWRRELVEIRGLIAGHQAVNLGAQASAYLLPIIVAARLGPTENAYFYATFMLANALFFIAPAISNSLFAEVVHDPASLHPNLRRAARHIALLAGAPAAVLLAAGPFLLGFFGADYADEGTTLLYVLIGSAVLDAGYQLAIAVLRARRRLRDAAFATWAVLGLGIGAAWVLLPPLGLAGAGIGWALGKAAGLIVALGFLGGRRKPFRPLAPPSTATRPDAR